MTGTLDTKDGRNGNELDELEISALLDGELEQEALLEVVDQLVESVDARAFYRRARRLGGLLERARSGVRSGELPPDLWPRIEREWLGGELERPLPTGRPPWLRGAGRWGARFAAAAVIAVAAWTAGRGWPGQGRIAGEVVRIELASDPGAMTDERFVELAAELLRADRRYHRAMGEIVEAVDRHDLETMGYPEVSPVAGEGRHLSAAAAIDPSGRNRSGDLWY